MYHGFHLVRLDDLIWVVKKMSFTNLSFEFEYKASVLVDAYSSLLPSIIIVIVTLMAFSLVNMRRGQESVQTDEDLLNIALLLFTRKLGECSFLICRGYAALRTLMLRARQRPLREQISHGKRRERCEE